MGQGWDRDAWRTSNLHSSTEFTALGRTLAIVGLTRPLRHLINLSKLAQSYNVKRHFSLNSEFHGSSGSATLTVPVILVGFPSSVLL